jgi:hypothetical protein
MHPDIAVLRGRRVSGCFRGNDWAEQDSDVRGWSQGEKKRYYAGGGSRLDFEKFFCASVPVKEN